MRCEGDNPGLLFSWQEGANAAGCFYAIQVWHLKVHEHNIIPGLADGFYGFYSIGCDISLMAYPLKQAQGNFLVDDIIFYQQYAQETCHGR
jgi:hypothetical protein